MSAEGKNNQSVILELYKANFDYAKHFTTLSTGLIVILIAFVEKVFPASTWKALVVVSIVGFTISILSGVIVHTTFVYGMAVGDKPPKWLTEVGGKSLVLMWLGFGIGILSMVAFAIRNLLR